MATLTRSDLLKILAAAEVGGPSRLGGLKFPVKQIGSVARDLRELVQKTFADGDVLPRIFVAKVRETEGWDLGKADTVLEALLADAESSLRGGESLDRFD